MNHIGSLIFIASYITAGARNILVKGMSSVNFNVFYCDTDSIVTDRPLE
jgi:hypothetical protein